MATPNVYETKLTMTSRNGPVNCIVSLGGSSILCGYEDKSLKLWDLTTQTCQKTYVGHNASVQCVAVVGDDKFVSGSSDNSLRIWDLLTGATKATLHGHTNQVQCVASLGPGRFVSGSLDCSLKIWDIPTAQCIATLSEHTRYIKCVVSLGDGRIVSGSGDQTLILWDVASKARIGVFLGHSNCVSCVVSLGDGRIVSGSEDQTLKVWDVNSRACLFTLLGHSKYVTCLASLGDGRIVSGSGDQTLKHWDVNVRSCLGTFPGHTSAVKCIDVMDGSRIVTGSADETIKLWDRAVSRPLTARLDRKEKKCFPAPTSQPSSTAFGSPFSFSAPGTPSNGAPATASIFGAPHTPFFGSPAQLFSFGTVQNNGTPISWTATSSNNGAFANLGERIINSPGNESASAASALSTPMKLLQKLRDNQSDANALASLLEIVSDDIDADDIIACVNGDLGYLCQRWSSISKEHILTDWIASMFPAIPLRWFDVHDALANKALAFKDILKAQLSGDGSIRTLLLEQQVFKNEWPQACYEAWVDLAGCAIDSSKQFDEFNLETLILTHKHSDSEPACTSANETENPASSSWQDAAFCFDASTASVNVQLSEDEKSVEFKGQHSGQNVIKLAPSLTCPNRYRLDMSLLTRGAPGTGIEIACIDEKIIMKLAFSGGGRNSALQIKASDANDKQLASGSCSDSDITLDINFSDGAISVLTTKAATIITSFHSEALLSIRSNLEIRVISSVRGVRACIKNCQVIKSSLQTTRENASPEAPVQQSLDDNIKRKSLLSQAKFLWSFANLEIENVTELTTPGVEGSGSEALDRIILASIEAFHSTAINIKMETKGTLISHFISHRLYNSVSAILALSGKSLLLSSAKQASMFSDLIKADTSFALDLLKSKLVAAGEPNPDIWECNIDKRQWDSWMASVVKKPISSFDVPVSNGERLLFLSMAFALSASALSSYGWDALRKYKTEHMDTKMSRLVKLCEARLYMRESKFDEARANLETYLLLGWYHKLMIPGMNENPDYLVNDNEKSFMLQENGTGSKSQKKTSSSNFNDKNSALEDWVEYSSVRTNVVSPAMNELMQLVGMEEVKRHALHVCMMMEAFAELPPRARVPVTLNFAFLGNPGTGKTTVARIFGKLLHEVGARRNDVFIEKTASALKREGGVEFAATVKNALGGVLFIDEAYQLDPLKDSIGKEIVDELLSAAENHREDLTIILAGYKDDVEKQLFGYNTGMASRFDSVIFNDFHDGQLRDIWDTFLKKHEWSVKDINVSNVAVRRVARQRGHKGFGNARSVRSSFQSAVKAATTRYARDKSTAKQCILMEDVLGRPPSRHMIPELDSSLRDLEHLSGLNEVKAAIYQLIDVATTNYGREVRGQPILELSLNRLMLGNPGTGKTTVAFIYGRVLKALGLVSKGDIETHAISDFIGSSAGESVAKTAAILELCRGKVLVIDEAYNLNDNVYGKQVLDTIVDKVTGTPGEDVAVLLIGYENEMRSLLRDQNPALARRFNLENALLFHDFDDMALAHIVSELCAIDDIEVPFDVLCCIVRTLSKSRELPNFGNAGSVRNLLSVAKAHMKSRMAKVSGSESRTQDNTLQMCDIEGSAADDYEALAPLRSMYAADSILQSIRALQLSLDVQRQQGGELLDVAGNWLFFGNPGTGKKTVAKCMGRFLKNMGVLNRDHVETTNAADLVGRFVGEAKSLVLSALRNARGGLLLIDDAYEFGRGHYGLDAINHLVELLTMQEYSHGTVVVMAGYEDAIKTMLKHNTELASRFQQTLHFPDWTAEDACNFVLEQMRSDGYQVGAGVSSALLSAFEELRTRPGWANARDATSAWRDRIQFERTKRVYEVEEATPTVLLEDVQVGMASLLAARPKGPSRRHHDALRHIQENCRSTSIKPIGKIHAIFDSERPGEDSPVMVSPGAAFIK